MTPETVAAGFGLILVAVGILVMTAVQLVRDDRRDQADQIEKAEEFGPDADECTWCDGTGLVRRMQMGVAVYITCTGCKGHGAIYDDNRHLFDNDDELYDWQRDSVFDGGDAA